MYSLVVNVDKIFKKIIRVACVEQKKTTTVNLKVMQLQF